jgi:hypothetical protein
MTRFSDMIVVTGERFMSQIAERILNEALQLPEAERADVATKLFDSLEPQIIGYDDAEW